MNNDKKNYWDLSYFFVGDDDSRIEKEKRIVKQKNYKFINKWKDRDDYLNEPAILEEALNEYEQLCGLYGTTGNFGYYFWLRFSQDQDNPILKARKNKLDDFSQKILNELRFFILRIAKIPERKQKEFLKFIGLNKYKHFLEKTFARSKYLLSEKEENILLLESRAGFSNWVDMVSNFISKEEANVVSKNGKNEIKNVSEILSLVSSKDKKVRDSASQVLNEIFKKYSEIAEHEINSILHFKKIEDELRKMKRPDLERHLDDDISSEVVDVLIDSVSNRFDLSRKYYALKSKLLGVEKLRYHERNVPYGKIDKKYSYKESMEMVLRVFKSLDQRFFEICEGFIKNGQIDSHPKKGKRNGAFCAHDLIIQPTYILLNHTDKLKDVLTIAHEVGHGINNEFMKEKQGALNFGTPKSTAEVASTFMEDFVLQDILKNADDELRLIVMMDKLDNDVSTIFRQVACYKFEQELHREFREKGYLSKEEIGNIFQKNMSSYMGESVEQSKGSENWWVYWSHIRSFFYVYSYASGSLISKSMQNSMRKNPEFIRKVKDFLAAGMSDSPRNIFQKMGIDITNKAFWEKGIDEIETLLMEVKELAKKTGKISV